jgi:hypothetical protein
LVIAAQLAGSSCTPPIVLSRVAVVPTACVRD